MAPPKLPDNVKRLHAVNRPSRKSRQRPRLVHRASGKLSHGQAVLLKHVPAELSAPLQDRFRELVAGAPWLEPQDRGLVLAFLVAADTASTANRELLRCMADPAFRDPESEPAQAGKLYSRLVSRQASLAASLARALGFSPAGRKALGIEIEPPAPDPRTPWPA